MNKFFSSLVLANVLATSVFAAEDSIDNASSEIKSESNVAEIPKKAKKENVLSNIIGDAKVSGFAFARYFTINGIGEGRGNGQSQQYRIKLDVTTGKVYGFSFTGGVFFSQGSSTPDRNNNTDDIVQGSRGFVSQGWSDRFGPSNVYFSYEIGDGLKTKIDAGKMNIELPFSDKALDLGTGARLNLTQKLAEKSKINYHVSFLDSWITDHSAYVIRRSTTPEDAAPGIGNNLTYIGIKGSDIAGLNFDAYLGNSWNLFDIHAYLSVGYKTKIGKSEIGILAQVSEMLMSGNPQLLIGVGLANTTFDERFQRNWARSRGLFNVQVSYKLGGISAKVGFLGSFGSGYGALLDYKNGMDTAGKVWNGNFTATYEGLGFFGSGAFHGSSIYAPYIAASYKFKNNIKIGIDFIYLFGNTYTPVLNVAEASNVGTSFGNNAGTNQLFIQNQRFLADASFMELTPSFSYSFRNLEISLFGAIFLGDIQFFKTRTEIKYTF